MQGQAPETKGLLLWDSYSNEFNVYGCNVFSIIFISGRLYKFRALHNDGQLRKSQATKAGRGEEV